VRIVILIEIKGCDLADEIGREPHRAITFDPINRF
jgi:hypothetical protein